MLMFLSVRNRVYVGSIADKIGESEEPHCIKNEVGITAGC